MRDALAGVSRWLRDVTQAPARQQVAAAVRLTARFLAAEHPGGAVEVRIPPYVAVQCIEGLTHKRGTPPNVIETDPRTWLQLATGVLDWHAAVDAAQVSTSGQRSDLSAILPLDLPA